MACSCTIRKFLAALGLASFVAASVAPTTSRADPIKVDLDINVSAGYARLVFKVDDDIEVGARAAGNVLIVSFAKPVLVSVDRLPMQAPDYFGAARRDPDGRAVRLALARKVTVHSMIAGDKFFVDLLPDSWSGPPPGLPADVVEELLRRAREVERLERLERQREQQKKLAQVRVRVASQPTFTRYVFDIPDQTSVSADRAKERLTLTFDAPIPFDLADAEAALPASVAAINAEVEQDSSLVRFSFLTKVDVRTFRDGKSYVVDVVGADGKAEEHGSAAGNAAPNVVRESAASAPAAPEGAAPDRPNPAAPATTVAQAPAETAKAAPAPAAAPEVKPAPSPAASDPAQPAPATAAPAPPPNLAAPNPAKPTTAGATSPAPPAPASSNQSAVPPAVSAAGRDAAAAKAEQPASAPAPAAPSSRRANADDTVTVELSRQGANLKLSFPFTTRTAAAVFQRADTLWIVFDAKCSIDLSALQGEASRTIRGAEFTRADDADVVRIRLDRPQLLSAAAEEPGWSVTIGDTVADPIHALDIARNIVASNRASATVLFEEPHQLHRIRDPEVGDDLLIVTGFAPSRGFVAEQDFVEFHALASTQGVAVQPLADDLAVELAPSKVVISRPGGLTLSSTLQNVLHGSALRPVMFDSQLWGFDQQATYSERQSKLIAAAAAAPPRKRLPPRLDLARFYIARDMFPEAKGVLDVALADEHAAGEDLSANVLRAVAEVMMNRPDDALKDLANPAIGNQHDAPLWRALAYAGQGKWALARDSFKSVEATVATLPIELQRIALKDEMRASIEVGDFGGAADHLNDIETIGLPRELQPAISVLIGRLAEGMGRTGDALTAYRTAADSWDRPAAAQGRLREVALRYALGDVKRAEAVSELETLTTIWRGDETEVEALQMLGRLYTDEGRYRDSFYVMRSAVAAHPDSDMTHRIQDEAAATFEALFLSGKGDALPTIEALGLFYDFRELTPIGRRGDEMIRRLADRLVSVDLLDQAADLLQYQVDHRLQGAGRAQVAIRLAVIYLMNRKSDRALATLRATRTADLANELRNQRLLLEARALSDLGRHDLALEVIANIEGRETIRLRSDILWTARRWGQSAEQIELYYGERWKDWQPLNETERTDILRAAIGYALAEDALGLNRFRDKYAAKMAQTTDARAFEIVSAPLGTSGAEFRDIARAAAAVDTLEGFLRDMQARYPDASPISPAAPQAAAPAAAAPESTAPDTRPAATSEPPLPPPPARAAGRTAQR
ncbi:MAG TPA: tetratricopeptide repeat protein [Xanthobacteraceae bacterium]|nr:tetratricopeptide repeat protein [Xanthobacteraceae bacterium]